MSVSHWYCIAPFSASSLRLACQISSVCLHKRCRNMRTPLLCIRSACLIYWMFHHSSLISMGDTHEAKGVRTACKIMTLFMKAPTRKRIFALYRRLPKAPLYTGMGASCVYAVFCMLSMFVYMQARDVTTSSSGRPSRTVSTVYLWQQSSTRRSFACTAASRLS